jgi:hypothetical protein
VRRRPWLAIGWFGSWGLFQAYAVYSVLSGTWRRPAAFPEGAYNALIYPDLVFLPLYLLTAALLLLRHPLGYVFGLVAGGGVVYVTIYLLALAGFKGVENLVFDGFFLIINLCAMGQIIRRALLYGRR